MRCGGQGGYVDGSLQPARPREPEAQGYSDENVGGIDSHGQLRGGHGLWGKSLENFSP